MNTAERFLYASDGTPACVQLPYGDYERLCQAGKEAVLLRGSLRQVADVLSSGGAVPQNPEPAPLPDSRLHVRPAACAPVQQPEPAPPVKTAARTERIDSREPVLLPPALQTFLREQDPSQNAVRLIETCVQKLSDLCGKRITLSLHKPYICLWDFDAWQTFAYGEIIGGCLYWSVSRSVLPDSPDGEVWTPPTGLSKHALVRRKVSAVSDDLIHWMHAAIRADIPAVA